MSKIEENEEQKIPEKYRPMGAWGYFGYSILYSIPLLGILCLIIFSLSDSNIARRNHARSYFCGIVLVIIILLMIPGLFTTLMQMLQLLF